MAQWTIQSSDDGATDQRQQRELPMVREGKTGLTIKNSTYEYAAPKKNDYNEEQTQRKEKIWWDDVVRAGMQDIEERGVVENPVTKSGGKSRGLSVHDETFQEVHKRKENFPLEVTWDDIIVHGIDRAIEGSEGIEGAYSGGLSEAAKEDVREIVDERIETRLDELLDDRIGEITADGGETGITEDHAKEIFRELLRDHVVPNARMDR